MDKIRNDFCTVRSFITLGAFFTIYGLTWFSKPVPQEILRIADMLLGYWFGSKVAQALQKNGEK
jgi:hypothetical protein